MPLVLSVLRNDSLERRIAVGEERIWIGRGAACDFAIDDASEDERIASLRYWNGEYLLVDGGDGRVVVAGVRLLARAARVIRPGDAIRIDRVELRLQRLEECDDDTRPNTMIAARQDMSTITPNVALVRVSEGPSLGRELVIMRDRSYVIGRNESCDLVLEDVDVSRRHLRVWRDSSQVMIEDLKSTHGTMLGARAVHAENPTEWTPWTMIRLGQSVIALDL